MDPINTTLALLAISRYKYSYTQTSLATPALLAQGEVICKNVGCYTKLKCLYTLIGKAGPWLASCYLWPFSGYLLMLPQMVALRYILELFEWFCLLALELVDEL